MIIPEWAKKRDQREKDKYMADMQVHAAKVLDLLAKENLTVRDFEAIKVIISQRFNKSFNEEGIKSLIINAKKKT